MTKTKKPTKRTRADDKHVDSEADALLKRSVALVFTLLTRGEELATDGDIDPTTLREIAGLARASATLAGELRAREKQAAQLAKTVNPQLVLAYLRGLSDGEWARLVREVDAARSGESVLA